MWAHATLPLLWEFLVLMKPILCTMPVMVAQVFRTTTVLSGITLVAATVHLTRAGRHV